MTKILALVAVATAAFTSAVHAGELAPMAGESIKLGSVTGSTYYTAGPDGFRVVTTLASGEDATPVRFVTTLQPGQRTTISVPRAVGETALEVDIARIGDTVQVTKGQKLASVD
jgi:hypothetical protein